MNVRNCRKCGKMFNYVSGPPICMECREALEVKFQEVKDYIRDNSHVTVNQVAEECDVSVNQIKQWLREERLELTDDSGIALFCEKCNAPIRSGRFCEKCKNDMANQLNDSIKKPKPEAPVQKKQTDQKSKMRFLN